MSVITGGLYKTSLIACRLGCHHSPLCVPHCTTCNPSTGASQAPSPIVVQVRANHNSQLSTVLRIHSNIQEESGCDLIAFANCTFTQNPAHITPESSKKHHQKDCIPPRLQTSPTERKMSVCGASDVRSLFDGGVGL